MKLNLKETTDLNSNRNLQPNLNTAKTTETPLVPVPNSYSYHTLAFISWFLFYTLLDKLAFFDEYGTVLPIQMYLPALGILELVAFVILKRGIKPSIVFGIFVALHVLAASVFVSVGHSKSYVRERLLNSMDNYKENSDYQKVWNKMQKDFSCCGTYRSEDWEPYFGDELPTSCFHVDNSVETINLNANVANISYHRVGCLQSFHSHIYNKMIKLTMVTMFYALLQIYVFFNYLSHNFGYLNSIAVMFSTVACIHMLYDRESLSKVL